MDDYKARKEAVLKRNEAMYSKKIEAAKKKLEEKEKRRKAVLKAREEQRAREEAEEAERRRKEEEERAREAGAYSTLLDLCNALITSISSSRASCRAGAH